MRDRLSFLFAIYQICFCMQWTPSTPRVTADHRPSWPPTPPHAQLFDMKKFQSNVNRELRRAYPDRRRLETQCLSLVAFVKAENDILDCPIWVLIVNVVAMDMLKSKLPPGKLSAFWRCNEIRPKTNVGRKLRAPVRPAQPQVSATGRKTRPIAFGRTNSSRFVCVPVNFDLDRMWSTFEHRGLCEQKNGHLIGFGIESFSFRRRLEIESIFWNYCR